MIVMPKKEEKKKLPMMWIAIGVIVLIIIILIAWYVGTYNALINVDQDVKRKWADVEVQYQRRIDLIPNLVNTVKGYMVFEQNVLTRVTELRTQWMAATTSEQRVETANQIESALKTIFATSENYPDLKANTQFTALMDELAGTENRVAVARTNYNEAVKNYNNLVKFIPSNIIAGMMGLKEKTMFEAITPGAQNAPSVNLTI